MTNDRFQLLNDAMSWMLRCFGRSVSLQEMLVGLCIWRVARGHEHSFTGQQITDELDIPYSTATRLLRNWVERDVIEHFPNGAGDGRQTVYRLTSRGIRLRDVLSRWDPPAS